MASVRSGAASRAGIGNVGTGEFNVNGQLVGATATTDDQVSVLELSFKAAGVGTGSIALGSGTAGASGATASLGTSAADGNIAHQLTTGSGGIYINGTLITSVANKDGASITSGTSSAYASNSSFVSAFVAKINAAGITNVTARVSGEGSTYTILATRGTDVKLAYSNANAVSVGSQFSNVGLVSQVVGSGAAASEVSTYNGQSGAISKAAAINSVQSRSGVTATAQATAISTTAAVTAGSLSATDLVINGIGIAATTGITASDGTGALRAAINAKTSLTGVTASINTSGFLVLGAADGRNISVAATATASTVTLIDAGVNVYRSTLKFVSNESITFTGTTTDVGALTTNTPYQPDLSQFAELARHQHSGRREHGHHVNRRGLVSSE